ncbi:MAG: flagella basal body P-ring formation protein FlgA [Candidatus Humimicrobiaceae bacterium]
MNRASLIFKQKFISIVFIAIALAGSILMYFYISKIKSFPMEETFSNEVFIAKEEITAGEEITPEMINKQKISKNIFSNNFIFDEKKIIGKPAADNILKGEIISSEKIEGSDDLLYKELKFSSYIPLFEKAAAVPVIYWGDISLICIGDKIDVISTYYEKDSGDLKSEIVLANKEIIIIYSQKNQEDENLKNNSALSVLNPETVLGNESKRLCLTFYLNDEEMKKVFGALQKGELNIAICSSRQMKGSFFPDE